MKELKVPPVSKPRQPFYEKNKAGYTAQDAPSTLLKITRDRRTDGRTDGPTDRRTDGRTDTTSYRDATAHLKTNQTSEWD